MKNWLLHTRNDTYYIGRNSLQTDVSTIDPDSILIGPSVTFRKHFTIPAEMDDESESIKTEMFAQFLPGNIDDFYTDFVKHSKPDQSRVAVYGAAVDTKRVDNLLDLFGSQKPVYFLELLFTDFPETTLVQIPTPDGTLNIQYEENFIQWSRFITENQSVSMDEIISELPDQYEESTNQRKLPDFPANSDDSSEWVDSITRYLPDEPPKARNILDKRKFGGVWESYRITLWAFLVLGIVTLGLWTWIERSKISEYSEWKQSQLKKVSSLKNGTNVTDLRNSVNQLKQRLGTQSNILNSKIYRKATQIDQAISENPIHLLRLTLDAQSSQIVFLTESLQKAETLRKQLSNQSLVESAEIINSDAQNINDFEYEVSIQIDWTNGE